MPKIVTGKYKRHYAWVFTWNNYKKRDYRALRTWPTSGACRYICWGREVGDTGTPHLQGFVYFTDAKSFTAVAKKFGGKAHIEVARTIGDAIEYCKKDGKFEEHGTCPAQGKRRDLDLYRTLADDQGMRVVTRTGNMQQIRVAEKYLEYNETQRDWVTKVIWLWGDSGSGKSRTAHAELKDLYDKDTFVKSTANKWWNGYDKHKGVLMDDFRATWWKLDEMLRLLDRYACLVEVKGGQRQFVPKTIYVTSILHPRDVFTFTRSEPYAQLERRITEVRHIVEESDEEEE